MMPRITAEGFVRAALLGALALLAIACAPAGQRGAQATHAIASAHPLATAAGEEVLQQGGNAFDAAVAVSAALAVVEPFGSGLGGGGFFLLHLAHDGRDVLVDARERAPLAATRTMYLDGAGRPRPRASLDGALAAGIPGTPAGLAWLSERYGRLPLAASLAPAVRYARAGFPVDARLHEMLQSQQERLAAYPATALVFLPGGRVPAPGLRLRQVDLAATLEALGRQGAAGFYRGAVAHALVDAVRAGGGIWSLQDLESYDVRERAPIKVRYRGATITGAGPPSSGGVAIGEALHILENFDLGRLDAAARVHLTAEAMRAAFRDRGRYLGDADFIDTPWRRLLQRDYAAEQARQIRPDRAGGAGEPGEIRDGSTTHFSIVDAAGNRVSATLSINTAFGSAQIAGATGVLLNNEMDDFAIAPGVPNAYGLVQGEANAIAPGKRPLSSMSPSFVEDERGVLVVGTPGGSRIISMVLLAILDYLHCPDWTPQGMVAAPRFHHQYLPDRIQVEPGAFDADLLAALGTMGHAVTEAARPWGNMNAVYVERASGRAFAAEDPRGAGAR